MADNPIPPTIPNAEFTAHLGSGGFANVFLYRQTNPTRDVAVKVLKRHATATQAAAFEAEGDLMAQVSHHPAIVTVFSQGVLTDGRPYLVMEYCPAPHLGRRARQQSYTVPQALDIGIRIGGAIETLHRRGILHRDVKPANILFTRFHEPVLTDFGIALSAAEGKREDVGFSLPWAPPEQHTGTSTLGPTLDVYSLGATLYTVLAGHAPFEIPGGDNRELPMLTRILRSNPPALQRPDVPPELERVLGIAMAKDPKNRYQSVYEFALALQEIQRALGQMPTPIAIEDEQSVALPDVDDDDRTAVAPLTQINPAAPSHASPWTNAEAAPPGQVPAPTVAEAPPSDAQSVATAHAAAQAQIAQGQPQVGQGHGQPASGGAPVVPGQVPGATGQAHSTLFPPTPQMGVGGQWPPTMYAGIPAAAATAPHPALGSQMPGGGQVPGVGQAAGGRKKLPIAAILVALAVTLVALGGITFGVWTYLRGEGSVETTDPMAQDQTPMPHDLPVNPTSDAITGLTGTTSDAGVTFTWDEHEDTTHYLYRVIDPLGDQTVRQTTNTTVTVDPVPGRTCLEVVATRSDGTSTIPTTECVVTP